MNPARKAFIGERSLRTQFKARQAIATAKTRIEGTARTLGGWAQLRGRSKGGARSGSSGQVVSVDSPDTSFYGNPQSVQIGSE